MFKRKILPALTFIFALIFTTTALADYQRTADNTVPAYQDESLTNRTGNERVDKGDRVTVHQETSRAYRVTYPTPRGSKTRWVPKNIFNGGGGGNSSLENMHLPAGASVFNLMDVVTLANNGGNGFQKGTKYSGSGQCRGFANKVYSRLFGLQGISGYTGNNYGAANYPGSHIVGQLHNFGAGDANAVKNLFWNVKPGAIIQMGRRHRLNSTKSAPAPHTAIFAGATENGSGCYFYEANTDGQNTIKFSFYSWNDLADKNKGFTVYEPNNYPSK